MASTSAADDPPEGGGAPPQPAAARAANKSKSHVTTKAALEAGDFCTPPPMRERLWKVVLKQHKVRRYGWPLVVLTILSAAALATAPGGPGVDGQLFDLYKSEEFYVAGIRAMMEPVIQAPRAQPGTATYRAREAHEPHVAELLELLQGERIPFLSSASAHQISLYLGRQMRTAFLQHPKNVLGNQMRRTFNIKAQVRCC